MSTQDTAGTAREGMTMSDETTMDTSETTRLHRCAKCGGERSAVESCEGDCYPLCGPCHVELRHEDAAVWRARVDAAERERDDRAATLETRTAEHALAMERVRELEARLTAARKATEDLPRHLGASWWGQQLRAALVEPTAEVSRG